MPRNSGSGRAAREAAGRLPTALTRHVADRLRKSWLASTWQESLLSGIVASAGFHPVGPQTDHLTPPNPEVTLTLLDEIASWDGKSVAALRSTYERHGADEDFIATVLEHLADVDLQRAATWLLKKHLEEGNSVSAADCQAIFRRLPVQGHWESRLNLLQCIPYLNIFENDRAGFEQFLEACLASENKFVRAWAYNGFHELSLRFPRYRDRVGRMLDHASESEAASVRARIRNIRKRR